MWFSPVCPFVFPMWSSCVSPLVVFSCCLLLVLLFLCVAPLSALCHSPRPSLRLLCFAVRMPRPLFATYLSPSASVAPVSVQCLAFASCVLPLPLLSRSFALVLPCLGLVAVSPSPLLARCTFALGVFEPFQDGLGFWVLQCFSFVLLSCWSSFVLASFQ